MRPAAVRRGRWGCGAALRLSAEGRKRPPHLGRRGASGAGAGGAAPRAARVPGLGPAPRRPMRACGRRGCPHILPAAPLCAADPLTPQPAPRPELGAPSSAPGHRALRLSGTPGAPGRLVASEPYGPPGG